jgi:hypothetical protein
MKKRTPTEKILLDKLNKSEDEDDYFKNPETKRIRRATSTLQATHHKRHHSPVVIEMPKNAPVWI